MKMTRKLLEMFLPIHTVSEANRSGEHWSAKHRRHKRHKRHVHIALLEKRNKINPPCHVKLTRMSPRDLDYDNLVSAFKWIKDAIAEYIHPGLAAGRADDDKLITWEYSQEKNKEKGIMIEVYQCAQA